MGFLNTDKGDDTTPGKLLRRGFIMLNPKCCVFKDHFHTWVLRSLSLPLLSTLPFCLFASYSPWDCCHDGQPPQSQFISRNVCLKSFDMLDARGRLGVRGGGGGSWGFIDPGGAHALCRAIAIELKHWGQAKSQVLAAGQPTAGLRWWGSNGARKPQVMLGDRQNVSSLFP